MNDARRVVERERHHGEAEADAPRLARYRGQHDLRAGGVRVIAEEVGLGRPDGAEAGRMVAS